MQFGQSHTPVLKRDEGVSASDLCKDFLKDFPSVQDDANQTHVDSVLLSLQKLSTICKEISDSFCESQDSTGEYMDTQRNRRMCFEATMQLKGCLELVKSFRYASLASLGGSAPKYVTKWMNQLTEFMKNLAGQISMLLQGCEGEIEQIVRESAIKIRSLAPNISKCVGALTMATGSSSNVLEEESQCQLSHRVKNSFLHGSDVFLRRMIAGSLMSLQKLLTQMDNNGLYENVSDLVRSGVDILQSCKDLQQHLHESSSYIREADLPPYYYEQYYKRVRSVLAEITSLVKTLQSLKSSCQRGKESGEDVEKLEEDVRHSAMQIARLCASQEGLSSLLNDALRLSGNPNANNNNSNNNSLSTSMYEVEEENARLCRNVEESVASFLDMLAVRSETVIDSLFDDTPVDTSRVTARRGSARSLLRSSMNQGRIQSAPTSLGSFIIAETVQKWLELADQEGESKRKTINRSAHYV